jgi:hypothetical protein
MPSDAPVFETVPIELLRFDPQNPRFPSRFNSHDLNEVLLFMLQDAGLIDLMRSIAKQGFFPGEPLLVSPDPDGGDSLIVVEGNRRLAACTLLVNPALAPANEKAVSEIAAGADLSRVNPVPCLRFNTREEILKHLGYRHVTGIKEWDPLAKARFLDQQFELESGSVPVRLRSIARSIGSRSDYVGRLLTAYRLYLVLEDNNFFDIERLTETNINFSLIPSVLAYENIIAYLGLDSSQDIAMEGLNLGRWEFLAKFIFAQEKGRTRLGESRNIRQLADILDHQRARDALESGVSLAQARKLLGGSETAFRGLVSQAEQNLELARGEMEGVHFGNDDLDTLDRIRKTAVLLRGSVQDLIDGVE